MTAHLIGQQMGLAETEAADLRQCSQEKSPRGFLGKESTPGLLQCTFFAHARDNRPRPWRGSWQALKMGLGRVFSPQAGNPGGTPKQSMPAICPAFFTPGATRSREAVQGVSLLILDVDNAREEQTGLFFSCPRTGGPSNRPKTIKVRIDAPVTPAEVHAALEQAGVASMGWTTWSNIAEHPKHRWVVPFVLPVPVDLWEQASNFALTKLGLDRFRRGLDLPVLHNPAALAFLPGGPTPGSIERFETIGSALEIPLVDLPALPWAVPTPWEAEILAQREADRSKGECWFKFYRAAGRPVDFKGLDLASILETRGLKVGYPRPYKTGTKRRAHCPWASEHTGGLDDDSVVLIQTPGSWPSFKCAHSGHQHLGLRDLLEWAWGLP